MRYDESVDAEDVPEAATRISRSSGVWVTLVKRAIVDHHGGRVTVVVFDTEEEYRKMRNGIAIPLRNAGYRSDIRVTENADGTFRVYVKLEERDPQPVVNNGRPRRPAASGIRPLRHG